MVRHGFCAEAARLVGAVKFASVVDEQHGGERDVGVPKGSFGEAPACAKDYVVGIHSSEVFAVGCGGEFVEAVRQPGWLVVAQNAEPRVASLYRVQKPGSGVCAAVVHDEHLRVARQRGDKAVEGGRQVPFTVEHGHDH